jgi:hypothetical protein
MSVEEFTKEKLWTVLVDVVHASVMYPSRKAYIRDNILCKKPEIKAVELANRLGMPLGEAIVILQELRAENQSSI